MNVLRVALSATIGKLLQSRAEKAVKKIELLSLISLSELAIPACDGSVVIKDADDIFIKKSLLDIKYGDIKLLSDTPSKKPTKTALANVYELKCDATFRQMFTQILCKKKHKNPRVLCLSEHQIVELVRTHKSLLMSSDGCSTLFPFLYANGKVGLVEFCFDVDNSTDKFAVYTYGLWSARRWYTSFTHRLIVLAPEKKSKNAKDPLMGRSFIRRIQ
ncbi:MAG: hypothetical protein AAB920_03005 [Patescibacteria group bacterium]